MKLFNLVKNELIKVFSKKAVLFICLLLVGYAFLSYKLYSDEDLWETIIPTSQLIEESEEELKSFDTSNPVDRQYYIDTYTVIESYKATEKFGGKSWQYAVFNNSNYPEKINDFLTAKFNGDNETYETLYKEYNDFIDKISKEEYLDFANEKLTELKKDKAGLEEILVDADQLTKNELEKQIRLINYDIEALEYRIKYNMPETMVPDVIFYYVENAKQYEEMNKDEKAYSTNSSLNDYRFVKKNYFISKYKIENEILVDDYKNASLKFSDAFIISSFFALIVIIVVAGGIVAEEFNKGTIKQLLLKPYTRSQILLSKLITCIIVTCLFMAFLLFVNYVLYGAVCGFDSYKYAVIDYDFNTNQIVTHNFLVSALINIAANVPFYLISLLVAFALSVLFKKDSIAIAGGFGLYLAGDIICAFVETSTKKIIAYLPFVCWNLSDFLYGGVSNIQYKTLGKSLVVDGVVVLSLIIISFITFKKTNIKNQ